MLQTAPLSAQEKFFVDEGILHHGYDWLQLAAYVPRADPALLPKLYRQACGLKPKTWKARLGFHLSLVSDVWGGTLML